MPLDSFIKSNPSAADEKAAEKKPAPRIAHAVWRNSGSNGQLSQTPNAVPDSTETSGTGIQQNALEGRPVANASVSPLSEKDQEMLCAVAAMQIRYGQPAEAISYLMMIRKVNPENSNCLRLLALAFMRLQRWPEANILLQELSDHDMSQPSLTDGMIFLYQSIVAFKSRRAAEAAGLFEKFRSFVSGSVQGNAS